MRHIGRSARRVCGAIKRPARQAVFFIFILASLARVVYSQRLPGGEESISNPLAGLSESPTAAADEPAEASSEAQTNRCNGPSGEWLARLVADLRQQNKLVGLGAVVMVDGQVVATAVDGERKLGSGVSVELGDRWHIGSVTKSVTATMIARLVESGKMQWSDTIGARFPNAAVHDDWKRATLAQLLTHTAGAPANFPMWVLLVRPAIGPECTKKRHEAVMNVIAQKPVSPPGQKYAYSNVGYTIAAAMAEMATGVSWEDLVRREVFEPLALESAGFGPPKSPDDTLPQPRGHLRTRDRKTSVSDNSDITPIIGPAGTVHMTLGDLGTYATEHLRGELGTGNLLSTETYRRLHAPNLENYGYGWVMKKPTDDLPYTTYWHNGSNTMWYALATFIPDKHMAVAVTSNDCDISQAQSAAWSIVQASAKQFNAQGE
ncbi:MAG TPA: serine hydrolase domain-containing protein [Pirellulales bacterium]|jgi:CubicO group peptidase (beta-lactamase class C family)